MIKEELNQILADHALWSEDSTKGKRAKLRGADLQDADLQGADLQCADLQGANLRGANLQDADLQDAALQGADLQCADLRGANLRGASLRDANLQGADLRGASAAIKMQCGNIDGYYWYTVNGRARVGCQEHPYNVWERLTYEDAQQWASDGEEWWRKYGPLILAAIKSTQST